MRYLAFGAILVVLAACSDSKPPPQEKTVFDPMLQQRDKAQALAEKLPQERKENLDRAIDADAN